MAIPSFYAIGTFSGGTTSPRTPSYPAQILADDIAVCYAISENNAVISFPGDWTKVEQRHQTTGATAAWAWKRCAGGESGTINVTRDTGVVMFFAGIATFRGCVASGTPYEDNTSNSGTSNAPTSMLITTTGPDRLATCLICVEDNVAPSALTGWLEKWDQATSQGNDGELAGDTKDLPAQGDVPQATCTLATSENWITFTFAFIPKATAHYYIEGTAVATGAAVGGRKLIAPRAGTAAGTGVAAGSRKANIKRTGTASGTGAAVGARTAMLKRTGMAAATGGATGVRKVLLRRAGTAAALGAATGVVNYLSGVIYIVGTAVAIGAASGARVFTGQRAGTATATGSATGERRALLKRTGPAIATGAASGARKAMLRRSGTAATVGAASGSRRLIIKRKGMAAAVGVASGSRRLLIKRGGTAIATGIATGTLTFGVLIQIVGTAVAMGVASGALIIKKRVATYIRAAVARALYIVDYIAPAFRLYADALPPKEIEL